MATQSEFVMRTGPNPGQSYALTKPDMLVGRDIGNDIVINDAEVSRKHARLIAQGERYVIEDLGSTNGTFINGQRIAGPHLLTSGEIVQMGENVTLLYSATVFDPDATAVMAAREAAKLDATPPPMPMPELMEMSEPEPMAAAEPPPYAQTMADQMEAAPAYEMPPAPAYEMPPAPAFSRPAEPTPAPMELPPMPSSTYSGPSMSEPPMAAPPKKKSNRTTLIAGCGCLAIIVCGSIGGLLYYIDANNLWCTWLSIC